MTKNETKSICKNQNRKRKKWNNADKQHYIRRKSTFSEQALYTA